jgi:NADPH:quinone reductase-like Zn-dependent oxidoreductase
MADAFSLQLRAPGQLTLQQRDIPVPRRGEAVVRLSATSVNFHDVIRVGGGYPHLPLPIIPFSDGCGEVVAVGEGVDRIKLGDRVMPNFFPNWIAGPVNGRVRAIVYGDQIDGTLQSHLCTNADAFVLAPPHLNDVEAATLGCAGLTAWRSVVALGSAQPGDVIVIEGTGGVSLFALSFAKMTGARVIITSSSDEKLERAKALGADDTINYRSTSDWADEVLKLTDGEGASHVIDIGGPQTLPLAIKAAKVGGRVSIIGARSGLDVEPIFPVRTVMRKNVTLTGLSVGSRSDFENMVRAVSTQRLKPTLSHVLPVDQAMEAIRLMESQQHFGKIGISITR